MLWMAAAVCLLEFFRAGEITMPSISAFDKAVHLLWGDVSTEQVESPFTEKVFLKRSKMDQFGHGTEVYLEATAIDLYPSRLWLSM